MNEIIHDSLTHQIEYSGWRNYTENWRCTFLGCDYEESRYIECQ